MSECFKRSEKLPYIAEHDANDNASSQDLEELILKMTAFHDHGRIHIGEVKKNIETHFVWVKIPLCKQKKYLQLFKLLSNRFWSHLSDVYAIDL